MGLPGPAATAAGPTEAGTANWRVVSASGRHTCGIRTTGRLYCWGSDGSGELGDGPALTIQATPVEVAA